MKTKLEWKLPVAVQWGGEAKQGMEEWTTLYRPSKVDISLPNQPSGSAFSSDFVLLTPE